MNGNLFFVALIVAIVMCASVVKSYIHQRAKDPQSDDEIMDTLAKMEALEDRVRVLERIVTENRYDLKKDIDSL